jgi:HEAT repeat protein
VSSELLEAIDRALDEPATAASAEVLRAFDGYVEPELDASDVAAFARARTDRLIAAAAAPEHRLRHAAVWLLGACGDARAVKPVLGVLVDQRDRYDHDFAYHALAELGDVALPLLAEIALSGSEVEAREAVQALGSSGADAWPALESVLRHRRPIPEGFFMACYNLRDPRVVPAALDALDDDAHRGDALLVLAEVLSASDRARLRAERPAEWAEWGDRIARVLALGDDDLVPLAAECLGHLGDERQLGTLVRLVEVAEQWEWVVRALGRFRTDASRTALIGLMGSEDSAVGLLCAVQVARDGDASAAAREEAWRRLLDGLLSFDEGAEDGLPEDDVDEAATCLAGEPSAVLRLVDRLVSAASDAERARVALALARVARSGELFALPTTHDSVLEQLGSGVAADAFVAAWEAVRFRFEPEE